MKRQSYQRGTITRVRRKHRPDLWVLRYYEYDLLGERVQRAATIASLEECPTKAAAERKAEPMRRRLNEANACVYFSQLAERYKAEGLPARHSSADAYLPVVRRLSARWDETRLDWMCTHPAEIEQWIKDLKTLPTKVAAAHPLGNKTKSNIRAILHRMFEVGMKWGYIPLQRNPIDLVEMRNLPNEYRRVRPHPVLTREQLLAVMDDQELPLFVRVMVKVAACTGMRASEVLGLRWEDVDFSGGQFHIRRSVVDQHVDAPKTAASERPVPMHESLAEVMREWSAAQPVIEGWVFGSIRTNRPFVRSGLQKYYLAEAGRRLGLPRLGWHTFRHTYRAMMRQNGEPLEIQRDLMRHTSVSMTERYGRETDVGNQLRKANARVVEIFSLAKTGTRE